MQKRSVGLWWNAGKREKSLPLARRTVSILETNQYRALLEPGLADALGWPELACGKDGFASCESLIVLGGDGTLLSALPMALPYDLPLIGVNLGRLGYLTEIEPDNLEIELPCHLRGEARIDRRMLLSARAGDGAPSDALNEAAITRAPTGMRIIGLSLYVNGELAQRFRGDGLLIATPTGSTAYSFSAGGPAVYPQADVFVVTPVCPHSLQSRPLIVPSDAVITVETDEEAQLALDGQVYGGGTTVSIAKSTRTARFSRLHQRSFYELLREKLNA